jgi:hypothetical protein
LSITSAETGRDQHMAAIAHPRPAGSRPQLRVIEGGRARCPSRAVYRRRRIVAVALLILVIAAAFAAMARAGVGPLAAPAVATPAPPRPAAEYVVQPGDTWWGIAARLHPHADLRPIVDRLAARNGGSALVVGQRVTTDVEPLDG